MNRWYRKGAAVGGLAALVASLAVLPGCPKSKPDLRLVVVEAGLYPQIQDRIATLKADWEAEGDQVEVISFAGDTPQELRALLKEKFDDPSNDLRGALLVGKLPIAARQFVGTTAGPSSGGGSAIIKSVENAPTDLYYADLNGVWKDEKANLFSGGAGSAPTDLVPGSDGIFDGHEGDIFPEIMIGRVCPATFQGNEVALTKAYFDKLHNYRTYGPQGTMCKSLTWLAEYPDFISGEPEIPLANSLFGDGDAVTPVGPEVPTESKFWEKMAAGYDWATIWAHGNGTQQKLNGSNWTPANAFQGKTIRSDFFLVQSCGVGAFARLNFTTQEMKYEYEYIAGRYIHTDPQNGLVVLTHTRPGAVFNNLDVFYDIVKDRFPIGEAQRSRLIVAMALGDYNEKYDGTEVLFGDPFLRLPPGCGAPPVVPAAVEIQSSGDKAADRQIMTALYNLKLRKVAGASATGGSNWVIDPVGISPVPTPTSSSRLTGGEQHWVINPDLPMPTGISPVPVPGSDTGRISISPVPSPTGLVESGGSHWVDKFSIEPIPSIRPVPMDSGELQARQLLLMRAVSAGTLKFWIPESLLAASGIASDLQGFEPPHPFVVESGLPTGFEPPHPFLEGSGR